MSDTTPETPDAPRPFEPGDRVIGGLGDSIRGTVVRVLDDDTFVLFFDGAESYPLPAALYRLDDTDPDADEGEL